MPTRLWAAERASVQRPLCPEILFDVMSSNVDVTDEANI